MATVYKRASAKRDLVQDYVYLAEHAGIETAEHFLSSADESFECLARHPGMGTALSLHDLKLTGLRKWRVNGFEKFDLLSAAPGRGFDRAGLACCAGLVGASWNPMRCDSPVGTALKF